MTINRREFIAALSAAAAAGVGVFAAPGAFAQSPTTTATSPYKRLLILVELKGANDGLNTFVPYADPAYYALRPTIGIKRDQVLQLNDKFGLHPALDLLMPMWSKGELATVTGLGYPQPNLSHFRSIEIWDTASNANDYLAEGWLARAFATVAPIMPPISAWEDEDGMP